MKKIIYRNQNLNEPLQTIAQINNSIIQVENNTNTSINDILQEIDAIKTANRSYSSRIIRVSKTDTTADFTCSDFANDWLCIKNAYDYCVSNNYNILYIEQGDYIIPSTILLVERIKPTSNFLIFGDGIGKTKLIGTKNSDYIMYNRDVNMISNFVVSDITFDMNNVTRGSVCAIASKSSGFVRCEVKNRVNQGWGIRFTVNDEQTNAQYGEDNFICDCIFDTASGFTGSVLLLNQKNFYFKGTNEFKNGVDTPHIELWQNCYNIYADTLLFKNNVRGECLYYSTSTADIHIDKIIAHNCARVLRGCNVPDHLQFSPQNGYNYCERLYIQSIYCEGGANSVNSTAIQIGGLKQYLIRDVIVRNYLIAFLFDDGNENSIYNATNGEVHITDISNINTTATLPDVNPTILFNKSGVYDLKIYSTYMSTHVQPIRFLGAGTYSNISIYNAHLACASGRQSISKETNTVLDNVRIIDAKNETKGTLANVYYGTNQSSSSRILQANEVSSINTIISSIYTTHAQCSIELLADTYDLSSVNNAIEIGTRSNFSISGKGKNVSVIKNGGIRKNSNTLTEYITVANLTIDVNYVASRVGLHLINNITHCDIHNVEVRNTSNTFAMQWGQIQDLLVTNSDFYDAGRDDGKDNSAGGVLITSVDTARFTACKFVKTENSAGGGLLTMGTSGTVHINDCDFINDFGTAYAGVSIEGQTGDSKILTIQDCYFLNSGINYGVNSNSSRVQKAVAQNNLFVGSSQQLTNEKIRGGIIAQKVDDFYCENNKLYNQNYSVRVLDVRYAYIANNTIDEPNPKNVFLNDRANISVDSTDVVYIVNNVLKKGANGKNAIFIKLKNNSKSYIMHNTIIEYANNEAILLDTTALTAQCTIYTTQYMYNTYLSQYNNQYVTFVIV